MSLRLPPRFLLPSRHRFLTTTPTHCRPAFATGPSPPRLPPKEQEEFERLQRASTGAFSTPKPKSLPSVTVNPTTSTTSSISSPPTTTSSPPAESSSKPEKREIATGSGTELHPDIRRGAKPEFEGERNPVTGEVGGPKNEPIRWGSGVGRGDWSFNGRVTDF